VAENGGATTVVEPAVSGAKSRSQSCSGDASSPISLSLKEGASATEAGDFLGLTVPNVLKALAQGPENMKTLNVEIVV
jgi:hypothetical protein